MRSRSRMPKASNGKSTSRHNLENDEYCQGKGKPGNDLIVGEGRAPAPIYWAPPRVISNPCCASQCVPRTQLARWGQRPGARGQDTVASHSWLQGARSRRKVYGARGGVLAGPCKGPVTCTPPKASDPLATWRRNFSGRWVKTVRRPLRAPETAGPTPPCTTGTW